MVGWLGRLLLEQPMAFALAARCVELAGELLGPEAERAADGSRLSFATSQLVRRVA
jgi:hypothetical protein